MEKTGNIKSMHMISDYSSLCHIEMSRHECHGHSTLEYLSIINVFMLIIKFLRLTGI